jgi:hypothetical protein
MERLVPNDDAGTFSPDHLKEIAAEVLGQFLRDVPEPERAAMLCQARKELGEVLCKAPTSMDPVGDFRLRANMAAAFRATFGDE